MIISNHFRTIVLNSIKIIVVDFIGFDDITKILTTKIVVASLLNSKNLINFENYSG